MHTRIYSCLFCLFSIVLLASCKSFQEPDFRYIENIKMGKLGLKESNVAFDLVYFNSNHSRFKVKNAEGDVWIDSTYLGHFTIDSFIHIPANAQFSVPVKLKMDMSYLLQNPAALISNQDVLVKAEGKARVGKGIFFINYPIHYRATHSLKELIK